MSNVRWLAAAHGTLAAIGVVAVIALMIPVEDSPLLRFEELNRVVFAGAVLTGLIVGLVEGLLLRLSNREVGQGIGVLLVMIAAVPVYAATMFAYAPWWRDENQQVPIGNLVTALATWLVFVVCLSVAALMTARMGWHPARLAKRVD